MNRSDRTRKEIREAAAKVSSETHLSEMEPTRWSDVLAPGNDLLPEHVRRAHCERFFERYSAATKKYLGALLDRHPQREELVEDCFQQFAIKFLEGKFGNTSAEGGGRFRYYLKTTLRNLVMNRYRERTACALDAEFAANIPEDRRTESDESLETILQDDLIRRGMQRLADEDAQNGTHLHTSMKLRSDHPDEDYSAIAIRVSDSLGKSVDAGWVRKRVFQARSRFREFIRDEIAATLSISSDLEVEDELAALGLLEIVGRRSS